MLRKYTLTAVVSCALVLFLVTSSSALFFDFASREQLDRWEVLNDVNGQWEIAGGVLKLTSGGKWNLLAIKNLEFTDGTIQYKLKWMEGGVCEVGVFYRLQESPNLPHYHVHISAMDVPPSGLKWAYCEKVTKNGASWSPTIDIPIPGWGKEPVNRWFEFKIEVKGDKHVVYAGLEGKLEKVVEVTHGEEQKGRVGIVSYSPIQETVLIDDFRVISSLDVAWENKLTTTWGEVKRNR